MLFQYEYNYTNVYNHTGTTSQHKEIVRYNNNVIRIHLISCWKNKTIFIINV